MLIMDTTDTTIIRILRRNGRASISDMALELGLSRATVRARIEKLEQSGEISGYSVVMRGDLEDFPVRAIILIALEGRGFDRVLGRLAALIEVRTLHTTNGKWDIIIEIDAQSLPELDDVLRRIRLIDGITTSETNVLLTTRRSAATATA